MPLRSLVAPLALLALSACDRAGGSTQWAGTIDTLESGIEVVRNPAEGIWDSATAWRLVEELRIGSVEGEGPETFALVVDVAVDAAGRIYALDRQLQEIRVFDTDGRYVRTLGGPGGGPGEFLQAAGMDVAPDGRLWVIDNQRPHYMVFDTSGAFFTSYPRHVTGFAFAWPGRWTRDGRLMDFTIFRDGEHTRYAITRYDSAARAFVDTSLLAAPSRERDIYDFRDARGLGMITSVPFAPQWRWVLSPAGRVWAGFADSYRLYEISLDGDTLRAVERPGAAVPVSARERDSAITRLREVARGHSFDPSRTPHVKPAFEAIDVDDRGYVWVRRPLPDTESGTTYDVLDDRGRYLGTLRAPELRTKEHLPVWIYGHALYAVHHDDLEVPYVVRYRIQGRR